MLQTEKYLKNRVWSNGDKFKSLVTKIKNKKYAKETKIARLNSTIRI